MPGVFNQWKIADSDPIELLNGMLTVNEKSCDSWFGIHPTTDCLAFMITLKPNSICQKNAKVLAEFLVKNNIPCVIDNTDLVFTDIKMKNNIVNMPELKCELKAAIDRIPGVRVENERLDKKFHFFS